MKATKKPVTVEVTQLKVKYKPMWYQDAYMNGIIVENDDGETGYIKTLEGNMEFDMNDIIIRGIQGELYPCKPDIFQKTYDVKIDGKLCLYAVQERIPTGNLHMHGLHGYVLTLDDKLLWANVFSPDGYIRFPKNEGWDMLERLFALNLIPLYMLEMVEASPYQDPPSALMCLDIDYEYNDNYQNDSKGFLELLNRKFGLKFIRTASESPDEDRDYTGDMSRDLFGV